MSFVFSLFLPLDSHQTAVARNLSICAVVAFFDFKNVARGWLEIEVALLKSAS